MSLITKEMDNNNAMNKGIQGNLYTRHYGKNNIDTDTGIHQS